MTLPPALRGSGSGRTLMYWGTLKSASAPRAKSTSSAGVTVTPASGTTAAATLRPSASSGRPTTATSATAG
jgi:hypothetical protein